MPTAAERQALLFLVAVALVGGGARMVSARQFEREVGRSQNDEGRVRDSDGALARQIAQVDSARASRATREASKPARRKRAVTDRAPPSSSSDRRQEPRLSEGGRAEPAGPIDVNTATAEELERLPRVGPALARRIVEYREQHGAFAGVDDLRHVRGIGVTTAKRLAPSVTFSHGYRPMRSEGRTGGREFHRP